jgi:FtsZ-binding cell division protein ZapB
MMECLLAKFDADRKTDREEFLARLEADMQANMEAWREELAARREMMDADTKAWQEKIAAMRNKRMDASHKEMVAESKPKMDVKTISCQEMEARPEERKPTSVDTKPEVAQKEEVPVQDATVMPVG